MQVYWRLQIVLFTCSIGLLGAEDPFSTTKWLHSQAVRLHNQGILFQESGRFAEAESAFREALRVWKKLPSTPSAEIAATSNGLGNLLRVEGHYVEAEHLLLQAIWWEEKGGASARLDLAFSLNSLGALYCDIRKPERATSPLERGLAIRQEILGSNHPLVAASLDNLAEMFIQRHNFDQAEALYRRSLSILETQSDSSLLAMTRCKLAKLYARQRRNPMQAEKLYREALGAWKQAPEHDHPQIGLTLTGLAEVYISQNNYAEAEPLLKEALDIQQTALGPNHPQVAEILLDYASLLRKRHRPRDAAQMEKRVKKIRTLTREKQVLLTVDVSSLRR
jgi:tetratricopeptide (TPR) repeat protein